MRSYSRNSRKPFSVPRLATAVSLLLGAAVHAEPSHNFVLTAFSNGAGGAELLSGDYQGANDALHHHFMYLATDGSATSNNRCVALAMLKQWEPARAACDRAVRDAQTERALLPSYQYWARKLKDDYLAVALSNRAVLHWMSSDSDGAANDLKRAEKLSPGADFVARNLAAIEHSRNAVAKVAVAPAADH